MENNTWYDLDQSIVLYFCVVLFIVSGAIPAEGFSVKTRPAEPALQGAEISVSLMVLPAGVSQDPKYPLGTTTGTVGETLELGTLDTVPRQPVQLKVELPGGRFFKTINTRQLRQGSTTVSVYSVGTSKGIKMAQRRMLLQPFPKRLMVRDMVVVENQSQSFVGGSDDPFVVDLPGVPDGVRPGPGISGKADWSLSDSLLKYQPYLKPGRNLLGFSYMIRTKDSLEWKYSPSHSLASIQISIPEMDGLTIETEGFKRQSSGKSGKRSMVQLQAKNISPDDQLQIQLKGLNNLSMKKGPMASSKRPGSSTDQKSSSTGRPSSTDSTNWAVIVSIVFSLLVFVTAYGYVQWQLGETSEVLDRSFVLEEIARLDQEFEDNAIDEPYYKRTRRRWKKAIDTPDSDEDENESINV
ncbi:MAG: hypothetical protein ABEJ65_10335 [bacterium]